MPRETLLPLVTNCISAVSALTMLHKATFLDTLRKANNLSKLDDDGLILSAEIAVISKLISTLQEYIAVVTEYHTITNLPLMVPGESFRNGKVFSVQLDERGYIYCWESNDGTVVYTRQEELTDSDMEIIVTSKNTKLENLVRPTTNRGNN